MSEILSMQRLREEDQRWVVGDTVQGFAKTSGVNVCSSHQGHRYRARIPCQYPSVNTGLKSKEQIEM